MGKYEVKIIECSTVSSLENSVNAYFKKIPRANEVVGVYYNRQKNLRPSAVILMKQNITANNWYLENQIHPVHNCENSSCEMKSNPYI